MPVIDDSMYEAVSPFYGELLHVNIARRDEQVRSDFISAFAVAASSISDDLLASLLSVEEWRSRMVAGWMVAVNERRHHLEAIRANLAAADLVYPHGLLIALAALPDDAGAQVLVEYLERWLAVDADHFHDQPWVLATLEEVDRRLGTEHAGPFVTPGGRWDAWAAESADRYRQAGREWLAQALWLVSECRRAGPTLP